MEQILLHPGSVFVVAAVVLLVLSALTWRKQLRFIFKSLGRNLRRTILTGLAIFVLVFVVT